MSPVTTIFEPKPRRVRNIFICSGEVFWASSRMMKESLSVRPRMKASGATSITPRSRCAVTFSASIMSWSASKSGRRYGSTFAMRSPGRKPEALAGLHRGAGEDDPVDLAALQRGRGHGHGEERLAGAGRADAEGDRRAADRVHVALLVDRLRGDLEVAVAPDDLVEHLARRLRLVEHARDRLDRRGPDVVPAGDELGELAHHRRGDLHRLGVPVEGDHVAAQEDVGAQVLLEGLEDLVLRAGQLGRHLVRQLQLPSSQVLPSPCSTPSCRRHARRRPPSPA